MRKSSRMIDSPESQNNIFPFVVDYTRVQSKLALRYDYWRREVLSNFGVTLGQLYNIFLLNYLILFRSFNAKLCRHHLKSTHWTRIAKYWPKQYTCHCCACHACPKFEEAIEAVPGTGMKFCVWRVKHLKQRWTITLLPKNFSLPIALHSHGIGFMWKMWKASGQRCWMCWSEKKLQS